MNGFFERNKVFIIVILATFGLIAGGIYLMSGKSSESAPTPVSSSILVPSGVYETSGFVNGNYLPASPSATVTLVEFGDYECPACSQYAPYIKQILTDNAGKVNFVFRQYPIPQHKNSLIASYAVEASGLQGRYWEMHEKVYATQIDWANASDPTSVFVTYANDVGLNQNQLLNDLNSQVIKDAVTRDVNDGNTIGITETPTFYINGVKVNLTGSFNQIGDLIEAQLSK
jgi:protein-disulfide isomerase